jgi:phytoene dehydrogenase-like protein
MSKKYDVIVVGAGPGGATSAAILAKEGFKILLLDKNTQAGGKTMTVMVSVTSIGQSAQRLRKVFSSRRLSRNWGWRNL